MLWSYINMVKYMANNRIKERVKKVPKHIKDKISKDIKSNREMYKPRKQVHWYYAIPEPLRSIVHEEFKRQHPDKTITEVQSILNSSCTMLLSGSGIA